MAGKIFWENQFNQMREGKEPALTIDQEQEREKPQIQLEDVNAPVKQDLSLQAADQGVGVTDVAKAAASGGVGWAESTAEILTEPQFRKTVSTTVPGMILSLSDYVPLIKDKITEARRGGQEALGQAKKSIRESMSEPAKKAIEAELINDNLEFTDDAAKLSTWIMKGTETISRMVPDLVAGGLVGKGLYNAAYETAYKAGIAKGLTEQGAKVSANKIASAAASVPTAFMATTSATGGAGVQAREAIESLPWSDLQKSEIFVNNFKSIDADPANESMSDQQKLSLARTLTAEHASSKIMQDPALLTVNALASFIGDATLGRMIAGKIGGGIVNKAVTGFAAEAPTEAAQSAAEQYAQNLILIDVAGQDVDPMKGVKRAAAEGGLLGGAVGGTVGGTVGAVDKVTGRESQPLEPQLDGPEIIPEEVATIADGDLQPGAAPEPLTVAERRAALNEKLAAQQEQLRRERVLAGTGEVQEALSKGQTAPTPIELIAQAKEQAKVQRDEFVEGRAAPTVAERRDNLKRRLEQQSAEYAKQQAEAGKGPVQERLSMPTSPTVDELLIKASSETGPSPYELEYRKQAERDYIEKVKDAAIPQGLKGKPNAVKLLNKGYRNAITDFGGLSEQLSKTTDPDPKTDTMAEVIGKMGGIGRATAESEGFDPAMFKGSKTFSANGKMTFDDAAEKLNELGYRNRQGDTLDSNDVVDMLYGEINNTENHYSTHVDPKMLTADAQVVRTWAKALGGADKLSATIKKSLAGERLGKRQAEVMEDMLDSIAAMRSEGAEQAKQTLDARRSEREAKRIESFNSLMAEATGNKSHIADIESYNKMLSEKPEYYSEEQVILDELVATAGDIDFNATSEAIDLYESGKTSLPNLLTKLSDIAHKRERTYAEAKPAIQKANQPTTQQLEGITSERVSPSETTQGTTARAEPVRTGRDEKYGIDVEMTSNNDGSYTIKNSDENSRDLTISSGYGGVYRGKQILNQIGEFVDANEIVQAGTGNVSSENAPYKGTKEETKKAVDLVAEIEFSRETGDMNKVAQLEGDLYNLVTGKKSDISATEKPKTDNNLDSPIADLVNLAKDFPSAEPAAGRAEVTNIDQRKDGSSTTVSDAGLTLLHGSPKSVINIDDVQIVRTGQKQGKKGRLYGGFYATSEEDIEQAKGYAGMSEGTPTIHNVRIKAGTKVLNKIGDITRLSENYINELTSQGYGLVVGKDPRGRTEYVVIDKNAIDSISSMDSVKDKTDLAKQRDRRHAELEVKQAEGLVLETQQKIEQQKATGGRTDILNTHLQRQISGANRIRAKYGLGQMKVETKPATAEVSGAEKAKVVNASSHKTVRDKVLAWADIKFGDTIIDHRGAFIGVAVADFDSKKPRAIKIRKSDGTTELYNFKSILGSDVEVMSIDAIGRTKVREELDSAATVMAESRPEKAPEVGTTLDETTEQQNRRILDAVKAEIVKGFSPKSNNDLKIIGLKVFGLDKSAQVDNNKLKLLQEAFETVEAQKRREAINRMLTVVKPEDMALKTAYSEAVSSYESQPNLDVRTAKSSDMQAYSTPTPMALLANIAAGVDSSTTVYEPTAGNGLLLMTANPKNTIANELDPVRASSLAWSGFDVTVSDATSNNIGTKVDAVLANPPFGKMPDGSVVVFDDYQGRKVTLKEIDHVIARNALEAMSDNGKATLIIGANMKEPGVYKGNQKAFLNFVYSNYNVAHHVEVDGTLYKGQGAGFPTQMIVIHGRVRGGTGKFAPISGVVKRINSWSELYENFKDAGLLDTKGQRFDGRAKSDGVVSSNTGKTELRGGVPEHTVESRISDIEAKREADNGLSKPTKLARSKSADIGKPTDGTVTSQPDISGTGLVGSPSVLSGKSISAKPVGQVKPVRLSVDETVEAKKPNTKTAPRQIDTKVDKANAFQAHYKTASNGFNEGVLTPNNMASYTQSALADLQERHGSVDKFVIDKLGYDSPEEMHAAFMGLQADAIALAIDNIENGRAIVIGDQTGVGKGRQAAGIIRYAMKKGKVPIFISQKPNLFTDMYDDLADIGVQSFKPLIMNDDKGYVSKGGEKLFNHTPAKRKELLNQITSSGLPEGYNGLFLTYSQIASDSKGFKTGLLNMLAENSLIIMDESHSAAGDSKTGLVFQDLVNKAFGVTYLSATYAKRPDNMMLYMRTDLGLATEDRQSLLDSVNAGGLGMQTYIAGKLAEAGQMVRRERSFDGISINNKVIDDKSGSTAKSFDKATKVLRTIQDLSSYWAAYVESELADYIQMKHGLDTAVGGNKADKNINVTSFSSIVHNNIAQLSLSLKAREIGRMAIDSIKEGKRPVIALDNTLGSALQSYMSDNGLSVGDKARDMTYATVIRNALDGVLSYTVKVPGETKGVSVKMPISQINSPIIKDLYDKAVSEIKDLATEGIPGSPIDAIRHEITKAGFTVSEITGRNVMIDYSNNNQIVTRPADEMDRRAVVDKFNSGSLDVLILNQAGSTGLSIHASEKFADTKPRHMIVAQPSLDINTYMQMLGRVNRTGQVALPSYDNVWLNLPSEKRPAAVLSRKMSSLNANTSGNTESATSVESVDMLNQYGDQVVKAFVDANGDYLSQFSPKLVDIPDVDSAVYFLGKLAVLPVSVQEEVISVVESEYVDLINYLDSTGQNDLNMTEIDLDAKPISQKKLAEGRKEAGVFSDPVYLTKVDAKATGKAPTWSQVKEALSLTSQADFDNAIAIASKDTEFESRLNEKLKELESRKSDLISKDKDIEAIRKAIDDQLVRISDYGSAASEVRNLFGKGGIYSHGSYINVVMSEGETAIPGVIVGIDYKHEKGNPYSSSKWKMKIMVADRIGKIDIPLSLAKKGSVQGKRWDNDRTMESRFNLEADKPARESRYVMTGNLVEAQALSHVKGQIKPITLNDGRIIQAMVLPRSFDAVDDVSQKLSVSHAQASKWLAETDRELGLMGLSNKSGDVTIRRHWKNDGSYVFEMPKSVSKGKQYWGNPAIEKVIGKQAVKGAGSLEVILNEQEMKRIVKIMDEISPLGIRNQAQISDYNKRSGKKENDFDTKGIKFSSDSIVTGNPKGMPVKEVEVVAKSFIKEYKGAAGIKSVVFKTQKDAMDYAGIQDDESVLRNAFYNPRTNEVVLIADNINGAADARKILRHEILTHHGLMRVVGQEEWQNIVNLVSASREAKSLKDIWADIDSRYEGFDENTKAEEVIANISEIEPSKLGEWGNRIIAAITRALRKAGLIGDKITATEIKDMIRIIGERIKTVSAGRAEIKNDIRFSQGQLTAKDGFSIPDETRKDAFLRSIQDKYQRLKVIQKAVKEQGGMIDESKDVYLAEELFHGKVGEDLRVMEDQYIKPLVEYMGKENVSREELDLYLIARHAPERNAQIAKINPDIQDGGSGMTDAEAAKVMDNFTREGTIAKMQAAAAFVDGIINSTKQRLIDSGLESQDVVDSWDATYKHYVPLKGFAVDESDTDGNRVKATGKGFSIHGNETMRAMGRRTVSESPLAYVISDATQSAIRARKNEVAQTMLKLVDANPDPELWQVFSSENPDVTRKITKRKDPVTGKTVETVVEAVMPMHAMKDKYLGAKMNGEQYYIKLHDPRLMEAMANLGVEQANILTKTVGRVTRVLSALITSYNPEFALSNFARDVQTAVYNVLAEAKIEGGKALGTKDLAKKMIKDLPNSMKALKRGFRDNDFTGEWGVFLKEYLDSGAKTGWFVQKDIDDIKNDITRSISTTGEGAVNKLIRSKDKLIKFIDDYNDVVENASRLSVYVNARRQGLTEKAAASLAKNLTVNFNRRGEMTNSINALYMFFNASVQGTANMLRAVMTPADKTKKIWDPEFYNLTQKIAMALPIATMLMAQANREWGGDDDDGKSFYDKVPNYVKETNFVLMIPGSEGDFIKIPMPYGYNFFASIGHAIDRGMNTESTAVESAFDAVAAFAGAFSPLGAVGSEEMTSQVVKTAAPAILKPFVEMALNENFTGAPIYKEQNPFGLKTPDAYNSQRKTWEWAKGLSEYLNDVTGGNQFKSGVVDIAPESWQHLIKFAGGGLGSLFGRAQDLAVKTAGGENVESREIPFWRKYMGSISESVDISEMYKRFDEIKTVEKQATMLPGQERIKFITENRAKVKLIAMAKGIQTELTKLNKQKAAIDASKLSDEQKQLRIEAIENRKRLMAAKFNKAYNESVK